MRIDILTVLPEMIDGCLNCSILRRAQDRGLAEIYLHNLRDYTTNKWRRTDDYPFGGEAGMVIQIEPVDRAISALQAERTYDEVIYTSPDGQRFDQPMANRLSLLQNLIILCGHYKGVDYRIREHLITLEISVGDYVLTGGELPAMVMVDAISRMAPGVLSNQESGEIESFEGNLLEYPQYTRPEVYEGLRVPSVLLSGDHKKVAQWRREQALLRTRERRPDLFSKVELTKADRKFLSEQEAKEAEKSEG